MEKVSAQASPSRRPRPRGLEQVLAIVERLADGIVIADHGGRIRFVNPAAEYLFGRPASELLDSELGFAIAPGENTEIEVVRPGGAVVHAELRVVDIEWDGQRGALVSLRDVTDRHHAEERARALARAETARAEAEAASQAKSEFLAVMSHELRTPLNAVLGYSELLDLGIAGTLTEEQRQQLGRIRASGRHLLTLVNEVLDLAKVEAGRLFVQRLTRRLADAVDSAMVLVEPHAQAKGIEFVRAADDDPDRLYVGDEDRVRQVLINLFSNAVKFTHPGGRVTITTGATEHPDAEGRLHGGPWTFVRVTDTGIGIPPDRIEAIFAPFTQVQSGWTRGQDGTGLGLTISRRLARLMGGDITVRSRPGDGSVFTLWLADPGPDARAPMIARHRISLSGREPRVKGFAEVGEALLRETEPILDGFIARLRADGDIASARNLPFSQLADHVATLLADVFGALIALEESAGQPSQLVADGADIQKLIAERHGAQRARLGWTEAAIRREHAILRQEIAAAVHRLFSSDVGRVRESAAVVERLLSQAEDVSAGALRRAQGSATGGGGATPDAGG